MEPREDTPPQGMKPGPRPDPARVRASALALVWGASSVYAAGLIALAIGAPGWTGGARLSALLPGVPAGLCLLLFALGRAPKRRRVTMALATATAGFLALATAASLGALGGPAPAAAGFQAACFIWSALFLAIGVPAWRRVNEEGEEADRLLRMYEEL